MKSVLNTHWKDWCWSWNSNTLATWYEELTPWKRPWCWERLKAGGEGDDRGWDSWMASPTQCTWVWVNSGRWWQTGRPGVLQSMGSQRVGHGWVTELNWTELWLLISLFLLYYPPFLPYFLILVCLLWVYGVKQFKGHLCPWVAQILWEYGQFISESLTRKCLEYLKQRDFCDKRIVMAENWDQRF